MDTTINKYYLYALWILSIIALVTLGMEVFANFFLFIGFGKTFQLFKRFVLPAVPYYIFLLTILMAAIKKDPWYLILSPLFFVLVMHNESYYLYVMIMKPKILTFMYTKVLAILSCLVVTGALALFLIFIYKRSNIIKRNT